MPASSHFIPYLVLALLMASAMLLFLLGIRSLWQSLTGRAPQKVEQRLQALAPPATEARQAAAQRPQGPVALPARWLKLHRLARVRQLESMLAQAGLRWPLHRLLLTCAASGLAGLLPVLLRQPGALPGTAVTIACSALPLLYIQWRRRQRLRLVEQQLPGALDLLARGLKAGQAFPAGLQMLAEELAPPLASEFQAVQEDLAFGISLQQALTNLCHRVPLSDIRFFVVAVLIQRESGGNLAEVLDKLSRLMRKRFQLRARVHILSSEGRLSAWVVGILPFALGGLFYLFNPDFITPLWQDPIGQAILKYVLALMAVGVVLLRKIVRIRI